MSADIEFDLADDPNWDLEIPLVMGTVDRGALAHRIRAWGAQQFAAGKAAAVAQLHPLWLAEKERADRLQAGRNEAAFDKLLEDSAADRAAEQPQDRGIELAFMGVPPGRCLHEFDCDVAGANYSIWRCRHCGAERKR